MRRLIYAVAFLAAVLIVPSYLYSQSTWRLPVPGPLTTGSLMYARSANELGAIDAVASGQILVSAGAGTAPTWSSSLPALGGTSVDQFLAFTTSLSPAQLATAVCSPNSTICSTSETFSNQGSLTASDKVFVMGPAFTSYEATKCPVIGATAPGTGQLKLIFAKITTSTCTPQSGDYQIFAIRT